MEKEKAKPYDRGELEGTKEKKYFVNMIICKIEKIIKKKRGERLKREAKIAYLKLMQGIIYMNKPEQILNIMYNYKVELSYVKNNTIEELITEKMKEKTDEELSKRVPEPKEIKQIKYQEIRYVPTNRIIENVEGWNEISTKIKQVIKLVPENIEI